MRIDWLVAPYSEWEAEAVIFFVIESSAEPPPDLKRWLESDGAWLSRSAALKDFRAKPQQVGVFYGPSHQRLHRVVFAGLGPEASFHVDELRKSAAAALRKCGELELGRVGIPLWALGGLPIDTASALEEVLTGAITGLHRYDALKTRDAEKSLHPESLVIWSETEPDEAVREAATRSDAMASGICLARDLVDAPANVATPSYMLATASQLAQTHGFSLNIIDREQAHALGMGGFSAVAQGSREPAYVIVLEHAPPGTEGDRPLALVGKGITFDTGGISLKHGDKLDAMKQDMAGAAAVLGVFQVLGRIETGRRVVGILPCTENMPDGKAYKPGDVVRTLSGLTVEVISTDAEGRMILCDALAYATRFEPEAIIDIATLTGACIIALGKKVAAVMGNRDDLVRSIHEIGMQVGERTWPLPLWDFYFEDIKSQVADFKNVGEKSAGTIIGGIFLKQFVPKEIPWAHLDIAGTAWTDKDPRGATGFGVRTLVELIRRWPDLGIG